MVQAQSAPPRVEGGLKEHAASGRHKDHFEYCYEGYRATGKPRTDTLRLGALCGYSNGMQAREPSWEPALGDDDPVLQVELKAEQCVRAMAAVSGPTTEFELEWREGPDLRVSCEHRGFGLCPTGGVICSDRPAHLQLVFRSDAQVDAFAADIWTLP